MSAIAETERIWSQLRAKTKEQLHDICGVYHKRLLPIHLGLDVELPQASSVETGLNIISAPLVRLGGTLPGAFSVGEPECHTKRIFQQNSVETCCADGGSHNCLAWLITDQAVFQNTHDAGSAAFCILVVHHSGQCYRVLVGSPW